jgi:AraC-like DNA-binding protein
MRRDEAIREMLRDAREIKAIARAVGFSDPRGFRRAFKRWTGLTPQQFRGRHRGANPPPGFQVGRWPAPAMSSAAG